MKIKNKPWGYEIWYAHKNGLYIGKKIFIKKGERMSLQVHTTKHETFFLDKGKAKVMVDDDIFTVKDKDPYEVRIFVIPPKTKHRIMAIEDSIFFESSTDHPDDVIRYDDDYDRLNQ